jgi:outer membrane protein OmpA-like peptidoglycan-associated protein
VRRAAAAAGLGFALRGPAEESARGQIGDPVPFARNQVTLSAPAQSVIAGQAAFLKEHPGVVATLTATCTPEEGKRFGPGVLATLRANKVRDELIARGGVARARVETAAAASAAAPVAV